MILLLRNYERIGKHQFIWNPHEMFSVVLFCTDVSLKHHLIVKCDIQMSFWYIQDMLQLYVGRCLQIHVILQDTKVIACHTNCGLQKGDCNAHINLSRKLILPLAKSLALLKKLFTWKKCHLEREKYSKCNFEFLTNKILLFVCILFKRSYNQKRTETFFSF